MGSVGIGLLTRSSFQRKERAVIATFFLQCLDPELKAELTAGKHKNYPALHWLYREGLAAEAEQLALREACADVIYGLEPRME